MDTATLPQNQVANHKPVTRSDGPTYPVLIGNSVKVFCTKDFADLPHLDHFMVKERIVDSSGLSKAKLKLKHCTTKRFVIELQQHMLRFMVQES